MVPAPGVRLGAYEIRHTTPKSRIPLLLRRLRSDAGGRRGRGRRITQIKVSDRLQVVVQLVDEGNAGRDVELDDRLLVDGVEIHHQRAQAVAVCGDPDA